MDTQLPVETTSPKNSLEVEPLIKAAFTRMKSRLLSYFLTLVLTWGLMIVMILAILIGALLVGLASTLHNPVLTIALAVILGVAGLAVYMYSVSWLQLAVVNVIIKDNLGAIASIKEVKPYVWGYVGLTFLFSLFMLGLLPLGILSLFVILILWSFWSSFMVFAYLEFHETGLKSLWRSRSIVNQNFWGIFGRVALVVIGMYVLYFILSFAGGIGNNQSPLVAILTFILSLLMTPFLLSYMYEIYRNMKRDVEYKTPMVWVILSIIGGVLMVLGVIGAIGSISKNLPEIQKTIQQEMNSKNSPYSPGMMKTKDNMMQQDDSNMMPSEEVTPNAY